MLLEKSKSHTFKIMIESGDAEYPGCVLHLEAFGWRLSCEIPPIVKPGVLQVRGEYNFDELIESRYGIYLFENHLNICYGRGDANFYRKEFGEEQRWSCFLPWNEWRQIRHSLFDACGGHFYSGNGRSYDAFRAKEDAVSKAVFRFKDFDGEEIEATTHIEEREWARGEGWFKWLSLLWPNKVRRSLQINFSSEVGPRKGPWKGGTVGHSIDMACGDTHESAFRRYCEQNGLVLL